MPQSLDKVLIHIVFSTKDRFPFINAAIRPRLHAYIAGVLNARECPAIVVGGAKDHVHILCVLARTVTIADGVKETKRASSLWMQEQDRVFEKFAWQRGYGVFSVSQSQIPAAIRYIESQDVHHQRMTFQDEFRAFLRRYGVEYDERYVWD